MVAIFSRPQCVDGFQETYFMIFALSIMSQHWDGAGTWMGPVTFTTKLTAVMVIQTARTSAGISFNPNIPDYPGLNALRWRHNEPDGVSNHQPRDYLLNCLFRFRSKNTSKLRVTGLCAENSPGTGEFSTQKASNSENVFIWWHHHGQRVNDMVTCTIIIGLLVSPCGYVSTWGHVDSLFVRKLILLCKSGKPLIWHFVIN